MTTTATTQTKKYRTFNPATGELVREFDALTDDQAEDALARAHEAFLSWRDTPIEERVRLFRRYTEVLKENRDELARLATIEMGKPVAESAGEVSMVIDMFEYYAEHGPALLADRSANVPGFSEAYTRLEPMGVVLGVEPWNGPIYQAMRATAPNLMLGNTVIVKPAEISAGSTLFLDTLIAEAGFPEGVYQTVLVNRDQVSRYIEDSRVRAVTLTGSDAAGAAIGAQAGRNIKPVVLELGGSDAYVVLESANVQAAATAGAQCRLGITGQVCASPKRVIVVDSVADEFIEAYTPVFAQQVIGDPLAEGTTLGSLSSPDALDTLQAQYDDAVSKGATVLVPGGRMDGPGAFFRPAVLTDVTPEMRLFSEEAFGPIGVIYRVADADAAVALANNSEYGLGGTVYAEDLDEARRVASQLDTGMVGINGWMGAPVQIPFGGTKRSGVGRELGVSGMDQFANVKTYTVR